MLCAAGFAVFDAHAELRLASPVKDNMVLQQRIPLPVWGTASPGEKVTVVFGRQKVSATADSNGQWRVTLKPLKARRDQTPAAMTVTGCDTAGVASIVVVTNVLVGEVWICSGQSNMEWPVSASANAKAEIEQADYPQIRMFTVPKKTAATPLAECDGHWAVCSPDTVNSFSAVGYFFARELHRELGIPVGMLHTSWGGSPVEPWTSLDALRATTSACERVAAYEKALAEYRTDREKFDADRTAAIRKQEEAVAQWNRRQIENDVGQRERWFTGADGSGTWKDTPIPMPAGAPLLKNYIGFVWCRTETEIPAAWLGRDLTLNIGPVDEEDLAYVNGTLVGETRDTSLWQTPRHYKVPAAVVTNRQVLIVVRVMNQFGAVGVNGLEGQFSLMPVTAEPEELPISLAGTWKYAFGSPIDLQTKPNIPIPSIPGASWDVSTLHNAMIAPLAPYAVRGAIWYQGESNSGRPLEYAELFPALIRSWRATWGQPKFSFLFVQLANFMQRQRAPIEPQSWAGIRDAQRGTLSVPDTGMAVTIDIGEAADIHPRNKQDVGKRLALWALARTYGKTRLVYSGPLYRRLTVEDNRAVVDFDQTGSGLMCKGSPLVGFAVAGEDKVFHRAQAAVAGKCVVVTSDKVPKPVAVRYAWANNPICNLYNREGLPASPFRTDEWPDAEAKAADETVEEPAAEGEQR
jgi:sialate O-acetylesterase